MQISEYLSKYDRPFVNLKEQEHNNRNLEQAFALRLVAVESSGRTLAAPLRACRTAPPAC